MLQLPPPPRGKLRSPTVVVSPSALFEAVMMEDDVCTGWPLSSFPFLCGALPGIE
jgi:hypothetical protein